MNLKNQPPIFVPEQFCKEIEALSKAALMDMVWDLATRCARPGIGQDGVMTEVRATSEIIAVYRKQDREKNGNLRDRLNAAEKPIPHDRYAV